MSTSAIREIRALRASPPGLVDESRRETYGSALEQFEQLVIAARSVGYATRPLLLFYAASQASRALAASRVLDRWMLQGHGLGWSERPTDDVLAWQVRTKPSKATDERQDAFAGLCEAVGAEPPTTTMALGALIAALPEIEPPDAIDALSRWPRALTIVFEHDRDPDTIPTAFRTSVAGYVSGASAASPDELEMELAGYGSATGYEVESYQHQGIEGLVLHQVDGDQLPVVYWAMPRRTDPRSVPDAIAPRDLNGVRRLIPDVGRRGGLPVLVMWTALLYALSMLARYEPAAWRRALDTDRSPAAATLEATLDAGLDALPAQVLAALKQSPWCIVERLVQSLPRRDAPESTA